MENYDDNKIEMVKKLDVYKEKALNGSLSQSELMELCDLIYGKGSKESFVVYERINELIKRNEKEFFTKKFMIVDSGNIGVTDEKKSIIGVQGLGPCIGLILYNKECKKAFVLHIKPEQIFDERLSNYNDAFSKRIAILYHQDKNLRISTHSNIYLARANYDLLIQGYEKIMEIAFDKYKKSLNVDLSTLAFAKVDNENVKKLVRSLDNYNQK